MKTKSPLMSCYKEISKVAYLTPSDKRPINFVFDYETAVLQLSVSFDRGKMIKEAEIDANAIFKDEFKDELSEDVCVFTDGSKSEGQFFDGFAVTFSTGEDLKFRSRSFASIFTLEAMAILEALIEAKRRPESSFRYLVTRRVY